MTARAAPPVFPPGGDNFVTLPGEYSEVAAFTNTLVYCFERIRIEEERRELDRLHTERQRRASA